MSNWPRQRDMNAYYGDPDVNDDGQADVRWVAANIVRVIPPYPLYFPTEYKDAHGRMVIVKRAKQLRFLSVHRRCEASLVRCLTNVGKAFSPAELRRLELDLCGGVYNFRLMRSGRALSIHSWGAAIDLSHLINAYKRKWRPEAGMMPVKVVDIFGEEGWTFGGPWRTPDAMHFQTASI